MVVWERTLVLAPADLALDERFYREEWQRVVQAQNITTLRAY